jgi:hypothetical protein
MDFDIKKRTGFLVNFAWNIAKAKEVPIHVHEHTLSRLGSAMPVARVHPTVVSDAHRGAPRLGDVSEQTNRVRSVPNDPLRSPIITSWSSKATNLPAVHDEIQNMVRIVRGQRVMLDFNLASG